MMELCISFQVWMQPFAHVFSPACFGLWSTLMTGWVLSQRTRFVSDLIVSSDATRRGAWVRYYRFLNRYPWSLDQVFRQLLSLIIQRFFPVGTLVTVAVDDTLFRKRGLGLFGVGMHHDPLISSKGKKLTSWGHNWVVISVLVEGLPWAPGIVWSLPVCFRLYVNRQGITKGKKSQGKKKTVQKKNKSTPGKEKKKQVSQKNAGHQTRPELAVQMLTMIAGWFPDRTFLVSGDSLYGGQSVVQHLPANMQLISRAPRNAALYAPAPLPSKNKKGRRRKKGERLPTIDQWADDPRSRWTNYEFDEYGLHMRLRWKHQDALYYTAGKSRLMRIVLVEDLSGGRGRQVFFCTTIQYGVPFILRTYAKRWSIEVCFENCKQLLGIADPAVRKQRAVRRTAPLAGVLYSLIVLWFDEVGHLSVQFPDRPWYRHKRTPSFGDMLTTLRRLSWEEKTRVAEHQGTLKKVLTQLTYFLSLAG